MQKIAAFPLIVLMALAACDDVSQQNTRSDAGTDAAPTDDGGVADNTAPETTITEAPSVATKEVSAAFEFASSEDGTFMCRLDGAAFANCTSPDNMVVAEGEHTFEVVAIDLAGNEDPTPASHTWTVDTTPPDTTITDAPPAPLDSSADVSFSFESEAGALFECSLDGAAFSICTSPLALTGLADGSHTFRVRAFDTVGNVDPTPAEHTWTIDTTFPDTVIDSGPAAVTSATSATFTFSSADAVSFECRLDGGAWAACVSGDVITGLGDGAHTFEVRAQDASGNFDPSPASATWTVDTADPDTTITSGPTGTVSSEDATFTFTSSESGGTFECSLDGAAFAVCVTPLGLTGLAQGEHTLRVRAVDTAGNADTTPATRTWTVDTQGPTVTITSGPADPTSATSASFAFASSDAGATFECRVDAGVYVACSSGAVFSGLSEGPHTFYVRALDGAGNTGPSASYAWTIDVTGPTVTIDIKPTNPSADTLPRFTFTASEAATFECRIGTGAYQSCPADITFGLQPDGDKTLYVRATDTAGTTGPEATYTWLIDSTPPVVSIDSGPAALTNDNTPTFVFSAVDATAVSFECRIGAGATYVSCASPLTYPVQTDGPKTFYVRATDALGNVSAPETYPWTIDATDPVIAIGTKPAVLSSDTAPTFSFSSVDAGVTFECRVDGTVANYAPCTSPTTFPLSDGPHTFYVRGLDAAGNVTVPSTYDWIIDSTDPVVSIGTKPAPITNDNTPTFSFSAVDASSVTFECRIDGTLAAYAPCTSPTTFATQTDAPHFFYVRGIDEAGNVSAEVSYPWTIDTGSPDTTIDAGPAGAVSSAGATLSFSADESGVTYECRLDGGAWASCTSSHVLSGLAQGAHTFDVRATDAAGNVDASPATRTWTVDTLDPDTFIGGGPTGTVSSTGATFTLTSDETGVNYECRLDAATAWSACSPSYVLSSLAQGAHTLRARAVDAAGNVDASPATRTWTVDTQGPTIVNLTGPASPTSETAATFTFAASEVDSSFECKIGAAGTYASCSSGDVFSPIAEGARTFYVRATDTVNNVGPEATHTWTVDVTVPDLTITAGPTGTVASANPTFEFSATDALAVTLACRMDGPPAIYTSCSSPKSYGPLADGPHRFYVRGTDAAGNVAVGERPFTVDTVDPAVAITAPLNGSTVTETKPSIEFTATDDTLQTVRCQIDSRGWINPCVSPLTFSGTPLADTEHTATVEATDAAGNVTSASVTWTVDTTGPTASITSTPANPTNSKTATFSFDAGGEAGVTYQCRVDGVEASYAPCVSGGAGSTFGGLAEGPHRFYVRGIDAIGNVGAAAEFPWSIDLTPPSVTDLVGPASPTADNTPTFTFSSNETGASFQCHIGSGTYAPCGSGDIYGVQTDGQKTFYVKATDEAGNTGLEATHTWTIDTTAPAVSISSPAANSTSGDTAPDIVFTATDLVGVSTVECKIDSRTYAPCTSPFLFSGPLLGSGVHSAYVKATDTAGNQTVRRSDWTVDATAPVVSISSGPSSPWPVNYGTLRFTSDDVNAAYLCSTDGVTYNSCTSPWIFRDLAWNAATRVYVKATDPYGNEGAAVWRDVNVQRGLALYYPYARNLANISELGSAHDAVASGGGRYVTGPFGHSRLLSEVTSSTITMPDTVDPMSASTKYTVATWFRSSGPASGGTAGLMDFRGSGGGCEVYHGVGSSNLNMCCSGDGGFSACTNFGAGVAGTWHHLALVYDGRAHGPGGGADVLVYLDGQFSIALRNGAKADIFSSKMQLDMVLGGNSGFYVDETRVYTDAYSPADLCKVVIGGKYFATNSYCKMPLPGAHIPFDDPKQTNVGWWSGEAVWGNAGLATHLKGLIVNAADFADPPGTYFRFYGVEIPFQGSLEHTVGAWFYEPSVRKGGAVFSFVGSTGVYIYHPDSSPTLDVCYRAANVADQCATVFYDAGTWNHIAIGHRRSSTTNGGDVLVYLNGRMELAIANPEQVNMFSKPGPLTVGQGSNMTIDDVKAYDMIFSDEFMCSHVAGMLWTGSGCKPF